MRFLKKLIALLRSVFFRRVEPRQVHKVFVDDKVITCEAIDAMPSYIRDRLLFCLYGAVWPEDLLPIKHGQALLVCEGVRVDLCDTAVVHSTAVHEPVRRLYLSGISVKTLQTTPDLIDLNSANGKQIESVYNKLRDTGLGYLTTEGNTQ